MSLGGVIGGGFNAFLAPVIFHNAWEYPLVLVLTALARPWNLALAGRRDLIMTTAGLVAVAAVAAMIVTGVMPTVLFLLVLVAALAALVLLRERALGFAAVTAALAVTAQIGASLDASAVVKRSFFGIHHVVTKTEPGIGPVRELVHGSILHGAELLDPARRCEPLTYYAPPTPIFRAIALARADKSAAEIGVVGLGAGSVATSTRTGDHLRFYEIDPAVVDIARDSGLFGFVSSACAKGRIDYSLGDGRLSLAHAAPGSLDVLLIDAFSSDSVPTHLLTTQAFGVYLNALKPDGVLRPAPQQPQPQPDRPRRRHRRRGRRERPGRALQGPAGAGAQGEVVGGDGRRPLPEGPGRLRRRPALEARPAVRRPPLDRRLRQRPRRPRRPHPGQAVTKAVPARAPPARARRFIASHAPL